MLDVPEAGYESDPLLLAGPLQSYVSRLPLAEFEEEDWRTLHNDLACHLADLLIRRDGATLDRRRRCRIRARLQLPPAGRGARRRCAHR